MEIFYKFKKVQWNSINQKQNELQKSNNKNSPTLSRNKITRTNKSREEEIIQYENPSPNKELWIDLLRISSIDQSPFTASQHQSAFSSQPKSIYSQSTPVGFKCATKVHLQPVNTSRL